MADIENKPPKSNKTWIAIVVIAALAIIGIIIWRMIAVPN